MKKIIISFLLVAVICVPVFSNVCPEFGAAASVSFDKGFKFNGVKVYGGAMIESAVYLNTTVGYMFSFDKNPAVSGVYVDINADLTSVSPFTTVYPIVGLCVDFHKIAGDVKINLGVVTGAMFSVFTSDLLKHVFPEAILRVNVINTSGAPVFNFETGSEYKGLY